MKRWLKTFNINLASEKTTRKTIDEWVGEGLRAELAPLSKTTVGSKRVEIIRRPWVYLYNVVVDELKENNLLFQHCFIPENEIHVKIGGDHGDKSFKMSYKISNFRNPNRKDNS